MKGLTFPLVEVSGSAYEMGHQHGAQAADLVERYLLWIEKLTGKPRDVLCGNAMGFVPFIEALSPQLLEEIRGLAAGADISFEEAVLCQARAEASHVDGGGCTAFALTGSATADGCPLAGQNQDLDPEYSDVTIVLRVRPGDGRPRAVMVTFAGQLGYAGMNELGLAHFANSLYNCPWRPGLPHYPLKRVMLEQRSLDACVDILKRNPTCSAGNMVLCIGSGEIADVEIRPEGVVRYGGEHPDAILHTNHYLTREYAPHEDGTLPDSPPRLARIQDLVQENWGGITVDTMKRILADHQGDPAGICRHGDTRMHSVAGYIADPARSVLHVRRGHGCLGTWEAYEV